VATKRQQNMSNDVNIKISAIVAMDNNRVIGNKDGDMPWYLKEDLQHFKNLTSGHTLIMGRKTFESIEKSTNGKMLPNRKIVVLTSNKNYAQEIDPEVSAEITSNVFVVNNPKEAISLAQKIEGEVENDSNDKEIFITGGGEIYRIFIEQEKVVDKIYITQIDAEFEGTTTFPEFEDSFTKDTTESKSSNDKESGLGFEFQTWIRK
jgi:dihydrofolate reductase